MADGCSRTLVFLNLVLITSIPNTSGLIRLEPEKPLLNQVLHHRKTVVYHLVQLERSRSYELRVSYPSTTPTDFYIQLAPQEAVQRRKTRKLLNIDKLVFRNDLTEQFANVTAIRAGVPYDPASLAEPVVYNIVLEELLLGIPWHAWRLVVLVILIAYVTVKCFVPRVLLFIEESMIVHEKR
ncbi:hypothetical protein OS493_032230 [Desmophyllum pertusum]|uniref:Uncharacterized protein n=1 Tax=Desmophyllum pertusum TaxID=174260 RepID=A0A9W9ZJF9_9CNID|nr:hypothetical protein OS493_032230 [Desmophyllum pertusum]